MRAGDKRIANAAASAHDKVEQAGRQVCPGNDFAQRDGRSRHQICRFPDHGVAECQRWCDFPYSRCGRKVPWADHGNNPDRIAAHIDLYVRADRIGIVANLAQHLGRVIGEELSCAIHLAAPFRAWLAFFAAEKFTQLISPCHQAVADMHQRCLAGLKTCSGPDFLCGTCRFKSGFKLAGAGLRIAADQIGNV